MNVHFKIIPEGQGNAPKLGLAEFQKQVFALFPEELATKVCNRTMFECSFTVEHNGKKYTIVTI